MLLRVGGWVVTPSRGKKIACCMHLCPPCSGTDGSGVNPFDGLGREGVQVWPGYRIGPCDMGVEAI